MSALSIAVWVMIGLTLICSFLPWANAGFFTVSGTDGDGVITLVLSLSTGGLFLGLERTRRVVFGVIATVCAVLTMAIYVFDLADISSAVDANAFISVSPGIGLILGAPASMAAVILLIIATAKGRS